MYSISQQKNIQQRPLIGSRPLIQPRPLVQPMPLVQPTSSLQIERRTPERRTSERRTPERRISPRNIGGLNINTGQEDDENSINPPIKNPITPGPSNPSDGAKSGGYGDWLRADPTNFVTSDFRDSDGDGVDDRLQMGAGQSAGLQGDQYEPYQDFLKLGKTRKDWFNKREKENASIYDSYKKLFG